jgi:hypothetical protein
VLAHDDALDVGRDAFSGLLDLRHCSSLDGALPPGTGG